jgi:hypothetical protein
MDFRGILTSGNAAHRIIKRLIDRPTQMLHTVKNIEEAGRLLRFRL